MCRKVVSVDEATNSLVTMEQYSLAVLFDDWVSLDIAHSGGWILQDSSLCQFVRRVVS